MAYVRKATLEDMHLLPGLLSQLTAVGNVSAEQLEAFYHTMVKNGLYVIYVVEVNGAVVGCATLLTEPKIIHGCSAVGHIEDVVIDAAHRRKGYGKMLIQHLMDEAQHHGCYKVILDASNDVSGFYQKCGLGPKSTSLALYFKSK